MSGHYVSNLYNAITKLIILLEQEFEAIINSQNAKTTKDRQNIASCLKQLVALTTQLNKLSKDLEAEKNRISKENASACESDQEIIQRFFEKYQESISKKK